MDLFILSTAVVVPNARVSVADIRRTEHSRWERQLGALSPPVRQRIESGLGITEVRRMTCLPSEAARRAALMALERANIEAARLTLILDFSTLPGDRPGIWSLAHKLQADLGCDEALPLSVTGSGCAGFFVALRLARAWLGAKSAEGAALLVASDRVAAGGRASLPISIMGDAASAVVVSANPRAMGPSVRVTGLCTTTLGMHHDIVTAQGSPPLIEVDAAAFEAKILPLHFVMCHRVLGRALAQAGRRLEDVEALGYPNTTELDRKSVTRALGMAPEKLTGPGPESLGHAFASDLVINFPLLSDGSPFGCAALLGVGSGFTWGACIIESGLVAPHPCTPE